MAKHCPALMENLHFLQYLALREHEIADARVFATLILHFKIQSHFLSKIYHDVLMLCLLENF